LKWKRKLRKYGSVDYIWAGIGSGSEFPRECLIKKHERGMITKIATYTLKEIKNVKMRDREFGKRKEKKK